MAIEELIFTRLSGFGGLTALVGTRIFPNRMPQDVIFPAVSCAGSRIPRRSRNR